eukprot:GHVU01097684.1.p1 GENE.GHVU01097684.1~~GHVU01097684.1.p1  ORF type:complete len:124 (+),score=4.64 GHVU01097684.1:191-562(+)
MAPKRKRDEAEELQWGAQALEDRDIHEKLSCKWCRRYGDRLVIQCRHPFCLYQWNEHKCTSRHKRNSAGSITTVVKRLRCLMQGGICLFQAPLLVVHQTLSQLLVGHRILNHLSVHRRPPSGN